MKGIAAYERALLKLHKEADWAEVNAQARESLLVGTAEGELVRTDANAQTAFYVRASAGRAGYAYTQDPQADAEALFRKAMENGMACETERANVLAPKGPAGDTPLPERAAVSDLLETAGRLAARAKAADSRVAQAQAAVRVDTLNARVLNTRGLDAGMSRRVYAAEVSVMAEQAGQQVNAEAQVTANTLEGLDLAAAADRAVWQASMQFSQGDLAPGRYPVLLDSSVVINIFTTAWQLFSAVKYAGGASALAGRLGEMIASPALAITDRRARAGCGYRFPVDDQGCAGQDIALVEAGSLCGLMHTLETAQALSAPPTGNAGRVALLTGAIPTELIVVPKVFCVEPGMLSREDLLREMGDGVWITRSFDVFHSVNVASGDFAIPCSGAVVEGGRVSRHVGGLTLSGNLPDLMGGVVAAGNDLWIDEFLLKSYCVGAPSLLVSKLQVSGRG